MMSKKVFIVVMKIICKYIRERRAMLMWKVIAKTLTEILRVQLAEV